MVVIACTGGIGAGKSTVAALLAERGAFVVDADALARAALAPGTAAVAAVLERFGASVADASGRIDRARLARLVFADPEALAALEAIVHPVVRDGIEAALASHAGTDDLVVLDLPLLVDRSGRRRYEVDAVLLVDCPADLALERLVGQRKMDPDDATARIAAQPSRADRLAEADLVLVNTGTTDELATMVDRAWAWITDRAKAPLPATPPSPAAGGSQASPSGHRGPLVVLAPAEPSEGGGDGR